MTSPLPAILLGVVVSTSAWAGSEERELRRAERHAAPATVRNITFREDGLLLQDTLRRGPGAVQPNLRVVHWLQRFLARGTNDNAIRIALDQGEDTALAHVFPFRGFIDRVPLDTEALELDAWHVELWYAHHGWFDAEFVAWEVREIRPAPRLPVLRPRRMRGPVVDVIGHVRPGQASLIETVEIRGVDHVSPTVLGSVTRRREGLEGEQFDIDAPYDLAELVRRELLENGYARATSTVSVVARPEEHAVDITVEADSGEICMFGEIEVVGMVDVREEDIRRQITLVPGERFDPREIERSQRNLFGLGTFSVVEIEPDTSGDGQVVPIKVTVTETRFRELQAGGGVALQSDQGQVRAVGRFGHVNLLNRLIRFEGEARGGWKTFRTGTVLRDNTMDETTEQLREDLVSGGPFIEATGSLIYPNILDSEWSHTPQVGFEFNRFPGYQVRDVTMSPRFTYAFSKQLTMTPGYRWNYRKETLEEGAALSADELGSLSIDPDNPEIEYHIHKLQLKGAWDTRRPLLQPARGHYAELTIAQAGAWMPGRTFAEARLDVRKYQTLVLPGPLRGFRPVLAGRAVGGILEPFGQDASRREIPYSERYYLGGATSVRGFGEDLLGPRGCSYTDPGSGEVISTDCVTTDFAAADVDVFPQGGQVAAYYSVEARIPFTPDYDLVLFHDNGALWASRAEVKGGAFQPTVGAGVRVATPAGPLRLDVAYRLNDDAAYQLDRRVAFYIALQEAF